MSNDESNRYRMANAVRLIPRREWDKATRGARRPTEDQLKVMSDREASAWLELIDCARWEGRI